MGEGIATRPSGTEPKAKVYIAYSQGDIAFVDRLRATLRARGFEPIVHVSENARAENEWVRIGDLAEAQAVVFVASPDPDPICMREVAFAQSRNKRLVQVIRRAVDEEIRATIAVGPEPIDFVDDAHFEVSADRLAQALSAGMKPEETASRPAVRTAQKSQAPRWLKVTTGTLLVPALWLFIAGFGAAMLPQVMDSVALFSLIPAVTLVWLIMRRSSIARSVVMLVLASVILLFVGLAVLVSIPKLSTYSARLLPEFPWPPPAASASYVMPGRLFENYVKVGQVASAIVSALERKGYVERSFFRTEAGGVALVTRLERMHDDGSSFPDGERWPAESLHRQSTQTIAGFLRGLFYVDPGRYRIIVFVIQDRPFSQSPRKITGEEARGWLRTGLNVLPRDVAEVLFVGGDCTVLIYEFASDGTEVRAVESRLSGKEHLEKAGILALVEDPK